MGGSGDHADRPSGFDVRDAWRQSRRRSRLDQEVIAAVRAQSAGRTRAEIDALVGAERHRRGLRPVPEPMLDLWIDAVLDDDPLARARSHVEAVATVVRVGAGLVHMLRKMGGEHTGSVDETDGDTDADTHTDIDSDDDDSIDAQGVGDDPSWFLPVGTDLEHTVLVELDPSAERHVDDTARSATVRFRGLSAVKVVLAPGAPPDETDTVLVELGGRPVGRLTAVDADVFRPYVRPGTPEQHPIDAFALVVRGRHGDRPKLYVAGPSALPHIGAQPTTAPDGPP
ncbi:MAG: hypothetical protein ABSG81_06575 [Acidimicrobiales bacterium]|jgi:hypothetical protein